MKITKEMTDAINKIIESMKVDYKRFMNEDSEIAEEMRKTFANKISYKVGSKYIKITSGGGVHSFIVNCETDKKFNYGDFLKAASWNTPARNFARGNVFKGDISTVCWAGL
jgi:hypothetical protein